MFKSKRNLRNVIVIIICLAANFFSIEVKSVNPTGLAEIGNTSLPNSLTEEYEKIILYPTTYTLVAFSATWCRPCIVMMPVLREIHEATEGLMDMVYINIDSRSMKDEWLTLLMENNIRWRSLWFTDHNLRRRWGVAGIPSYILVAPNGYARIISLFTQEDVQALFSIIGVTPIRVQAPFPYQIIRRGANQ
jgi:thiol-disulfide isomerase/thioredoxin